MTIKQRGLCFKNQELFIALEDLDRTGKLRKTSYKERVNFTLDEELMNRLRSYCIKNKIRMSNKVEDLIKEFLDKEK